MASWREDIITAMQNLGGVAEYADLYDEVRRIREERMPESWQAIIRRVIETNSSDSEVFDQKNDLFYSVHGLGKGVWGLRSALFTTPFASDITSPELPERAICETYRILRDTPLARSLKKLYKDKCQICGNALQLEDRSYSEAHHIRPLGNPHKGLDVAGNIIVLCPNHHVLCDYGAIKLNLSKLTIHSKHQIDQVAIDYHNNQIAKFRQNEYF